MLMPCSWQVESWNEAIRRRERIEKAKVALAILTAVIIGLVPLALWICNGPVC